MSELNQQLVQQATEATTAAKMTAGATYGVSITTAAGGALSVQEMALYGGIAIAGLTFVVNGVFQALRYRREGQIAATELAIKRATLQKLRDEIEMCPRRQDRDRQAASKRPLR